MLVFIHGKILFSHNFYIVLVKQKSICLFNFYNGYVTCIIVKTAFSILKYLTPYKGLNVFFDRFLLKIIK